ncbi:hypothetical protein [Streptomyces sp. NPDC006784]|uniref:hypothetical protein n=1 Tax=Streptomyces sp. NPDC006784 TaxID=3364764 RepID=UPI0036995319
MNNHHSQIGEKERAIMILINKAGRIASGDEQGKFVKIEELSGAPTSYLVLTAADRDFQLAGGDEWVEDYASLEQFFEEARWVVVWEDDSQA